VGKERTYNFSVQKALRKDQRNNPTEAEIILWSYLKNKRLSGKKFRRQHGIGDYIVDFYCPECRVIVELDGAPHFTEETAEYDRVRTKYFEGKGLRVIRFQNCEVRNDLRRVLEAISRALQQPPRLRY
jgi:very-short-patch-repair endonuclease